MNQRISRPDLIRRARKIAAEARAMLYPEPVDACPECRELENRFDEQRLLMEDVLYFLAQDPSPIQCKRTCQGIPERWSYNGNSWYGTHFEMMTALLKEYGLGPGS